MLSWTELQQPKDATALQWIESTLDVVINWTTATKWRYCTAVNSEHSGCCHELNYNNQRTPLHCSEKRTLWILSWTELQQPKDATALHWIESTLDVVTNWITTAKGRYCCTAVNLRALCMLSWTKLQQPKDATALQWTESTLDVVVNRITTAKGRYCTAVNRAHSWCCHELNYNSQRTLLHCSE